MKALKNILIVTLILLFCCNTHFIQGQETELTNIKSDSLYFESPILLECNLQFPDDYNPDKSFPLVISLHGGGGSYETFMNIWKHFENPQFIMATPQAPYKWLLEDKIGYDWSAWPTGDLKIMAKALILTSKYIENLILSLTEKYKINEVYLMGFSQGSIITQIAGINNFELLSGMIILSGPPLYVSVWSPWVDFFEIEWPAEESVRSANKLKVFIAHGKSDEIIDIEFAYQTRELFTKFGYDLILFEFEGGHEINAEIMKKIENWIKN